jgi:hypothetical protein
LNGERPGNATIDRSDVAALKIRLVAVVDNDLSEASLAGHLSCPGKVSIANHESTRLNEVGVGLVFQSCLFRPVVESGDGQTAAIATRTRVEAKPGSQRPTSMVKQLESKAKDSAQRENAVV